MASTNETNNLHLSQFAESDQPGWQVDYNKDMKKIDEGVALKANLASLQTFINDGERRVPNTWYCVNPAAAEDARLYKPWYECFETFTLPASGRALVFEKIKNAENLRYVYGNRVAPETGIVQGPLPLVSDVNVTQQVGVQGIRATQLYLYTASSQTAYTGVFCFQYTKTTDSVQTKAEILEER